MEETERTQSERSNFTVLDKYSQPTTIAVEQSPSGKTVIDVYGQQIEPICFQLMVTAVVHVNAAIHSIMLLECHYGQNREISSLRKFRCNST
jgi:hypothetical protein